MSKNQSGFSLIEVALVLIIVSLALGGILVPLNAQIQQRRLLETTELLNNVNQALLGFAISNGRLPCPATATSMGIESPGVGVGVCSNPYDGYVPAVSLGLGHLDSQGYLIDAWNNRVRYAVANKPSTIFTTPSGLNTSNLNTASELFVCSSATGISISTKTCATTTLSSGPVAVIFSVGPDGAVPKSADETENLNANPAFVSHPPTPAGSTTGEFDDVVIWLSPDILFTAMNNVGQIQPPPP